jgi:hypothetical protein
VVLEDVEDGVEGGGVMTGGGGWGDDELVPSKKSNRPAITRTIE